MNDTLPSQICTNNYQHGEIRQNLRDVVDTPFLGVRPAQSQEFTRVSYSGSRTFKVRTPEFGEVGLSQSEIDHAIQYGITI
jgi:hypothetical protein